MPLRRIFLVLAMLALLVISAMPAIAQNYGNDDWGDDNDWGDDDRQPREPSCDWYDASFDVGRRADDNRVWGWWCHYPRSGWSLLGLYYEDYGWVPLY
jgi:hypothetical protein